MQGWKQYQMEEPLTKDTNKALCMGTKYYQWEENVCQCYYTDMAGNWNIGDGPDKTKPFYETYQAAILDKPTIIYTDEKEKRKLEQPVLIRKTYRDLDEEDEDYCDGCRVLKLKESSDEYFYAACQECNKEFVILRRLSL